MFFFHNICIRNAGFKPNFPLTTNSSWFPTSHRAANKVTSLFRTRKSQEKMKIQLIKKKLLFSWSILFRAFEHFVIAGIFHKCFVVLVSIFVLDKVPNRRYEWFIIAEMLGSKYEQQHSKSAIKAKCFMQHEITLELDKRNETTCTLLISKLHTT